MFHQGGFLARAAMDKLRNTGAKNKHGTHTTEGLQATCLHHLAAQQNTTQHPKGAL